MLPRERALAAIEHLVGVLYHLLLNSELKFFDMLSGRFFRLKGVFTAREAVVSVNVKLFNHILDMFFLTGTAGIDVFTTSRLR